ncbi:MAG: DUF6089 family protein [Bacteroidia bacterium]
MRVVKNQRSTLKSGILQANRALMKNLTLFIFITSLCFASKSFAQYRYGYFRVGVSVGTTNYLGDLDNDFTFQFTKPGFGAMGVYQFHPHMSARLQVFQGWVGATDELNAPPRKYRGLSFRSPVSEASLSLSYDLYGLIRNFKFRTKFNPYVFAGIGVFKFNPKAKLGNQWYDLQPLGTEGQYLPSTSNKQYPKPYALTQLCVPIGGGIHLYLGKRWTLDLEMGWRKLFTDYLDDVSGKYPDRAAMLAYNPVAFQLSDRADPNVWPNGNPYIRGDKTQADWYIYTAANVSYILDWVKCPKFKKPARKR